METRVFYGDLIMQRFLTSLFSKMSPLKPTGFINAINKGVALPFNLNVDNSILRGIPISYDYSLPLVFLRFFSRYNVSLYIAEIIAAAPASRKPTRFVNDISRGVLN